MVIGTLFCACCCAWGFELQTDPVRSTQGLSLGIVLTVTSPVGPVLHKIWFSLTASGEHSVDECICVGKGFDSDADPAQFQSENTCWFLYLSGLVVLVDGRVQETFVVSLRSHKPHPCFRIGVRHGKNLIDACYEICGDAGLGTVLGVEGEETTDPGPPWIALPWQRVSGSVAGAVLGQSGMVPYDGDENGSRHTVLLL